MKPLFGARSNDAWTDGWPTSYVLFTVFQLYQDDGMQIMKGCVQWNPVIGRKDSRL